MDKIGVLRVKVALEHGVEAAGGLERRRPGHQQVGEQRVLKEAPCGGGLARGALCARGNERRVQCADELVRLARRSPLRDVLHRVRRSAVRRATT